MGVDPILYGTHPPAPWEAKRKSQKLFRYAVMAEKHGNVPLTGSDYNFCGETKYFHAAIKFSRAYGYT